MAALRTGDGFPDVVVTAVVSTTALAVGAEETWQRLRMCASGIGMLDKWFVEELNSPVRIGGLLLDSFDEELSRVEQRRTSFMQKMSTVLRRRLWKAAGDPDVDKRRLTASVGLALGSTERFPPSTTTGGRRACARCRR